MQRVTKIIIEHAWGMADPNLKSRNCSNLNIRPSRVTSGRSARVHQDVPLQFNIVDNVSGCVLYHLWSGSEKWYYRGQHRRRDAPAVVGLGF